MATLATVDALAPPLKWAGGKRWQVAHLRRLWRGHAGRRLVEPFCGGLAVALGLDADAALLNDANPHLINFYQWLRRGLRPAGVEMRNESETYYANRERFNELLRGDGSSSEEAALLFYYLNRTGYNGLCRFNNRGEYNVPFGRYQRINYATDFTAYRDRFSAWTFTSMDFERLELQPDDFVYADPPYHTTFTAYASGGFSWDDQERTAVWLTRHPGPVVLVNQATRRIEETYRELGYRVRFLDAPRRIACNGNRTPAREIIATRNLSV